ncbi:MAG TPA: 6-phosphofructokinase [Bacteroidales bacterium]|nr:6-phosphofructokinase [Bacteroidales bacterium]
MEQIKRIGVLTSGGDSPGMNAAIRATVRSGLQAGFEMFGIRRGYMGMIEGDIIPMNSQSVSGIIQRGGTILLTARCKEFMEYEGRKKAYEQLVKFGIQAVIAIGGDGTFTGASIMTKEFDIPIIGIPGTIDNDLYGTDYTIGYDTALNTVVEAVDKLRDTASSHGRIFFVEVMGREAGFLALRSGIACGAEAIMIPEVKGQYDKLREHMAHRIEKRKSSIIIVAEGEEEGGAVTIAKKINTEFPELSIRTTILGHIQRGGNPSAFDRVTASRMGAAAIDALIDDQKSIMIGIVNNEIVHVPLIKSIKLHKDVNSELVKLAEVIR